MNEKELILKALTTMSVRYGKKEIEVVENVVVMVNAVLDIRPVGNRKLLSVYMYAFGCFEIYRTIVLNGGFIASSLSGIDSISSSVGIARVIFIEAYSSVFISSIDERNKFECEIDMMCSALYKTALLHYLSSHRTDFLFNKLKLQDLISAEEAEEIERYMTLLNELTLLR